MKFEPPVPRVFTFGPLLDQGSKSGSKKDVFEKIFVCLEYDLTNFRAENIKIALGGRELGIANPAEVLQQVPMRRQLPRHRGRRAGHLSGQHSSAHHRGNRVATHGSRSAGPRCVLYRASHCVSGPSVPGGRQHHLRHPDAGTEHHLQRGVASVHQLEQVCQPIFRGGAVAFAVLLCAWRDGHGQRLQLGELCEIETLADTRVLPVSRSESVCPL